MILPCKCNSVQIDACLPDDCPAIMYDLLLAKRLAHLAKAGAVIVLSTIIDVTAENVNKGYQIWFDMEASVLKYGWLLLVGQKHS